MVDRNHWGPLLQSTVWLGPHLGHMTATLSLPISRMQCLPGSDRKWDSSIYPGKASPGVMRQTRSFAAELLKEGYLRLRIVIIVAELIQQKGRMPHTSRGMH